MSNKRIELWLKESGAIEQITNHEAFSEKIKNSHEKQFNVAIIGPTYSFFYKVYYDENLKIFGYSAMHVPNSQIQKAIKVGLDLIALRG